MMYYNATFLFRPLHSTVLLTIALIKRKIHRRVLYEVVVANASALQLAFILSCLIDLRYRIVIHFYLYFYSYSLSNDHLFYCNLNFC